MSRDYIIEFIQIGNSVKVSAVDSATGTEVSIVAAPGMSRDMMTSVAVRKLEYRLAREREQRPRR